MPRHSSIANSAGNGGSARLGETERAHNAASCVAPDPHGNPIGSAAYRSIARPSRAVSGGQTQAGKKSRY